MTRRLSQIEQKVNLDRDLKDITARLSNIEGSIKIIESRDARIATLEFKVIDLEKRVMALEGYFSGGIKTVVGAVIVALLSLVVGVSRQ